MKKSIFKYKRIYLVLISLFVFIVLFSNYAIELAVEGKTYNKIENVKKNKVGLVLGTSKTLKNGRLNLYFKYRIEAVIKLYNSNKIEFILISGDNSSENYDEPTDFKQELIKSGIPENIIYLDYAGFRTLDSVIRAKEIFGINNVTIISQKFHNERAVFLAEKNGITAIGYNAKDVKGKNGIKTKVREYFARTKVFIDLFFGVTPKFLGEKIEIN